MIASAMCHCMLAVLILLRATLEARAFTPWRDNFACTHHLYAVGERQTSSPRRCEQYAISSQNRASLSKDNDDKIPVSNDAEVTGVTLKMAFDSSVVWGVADLSETKSERFTSLESLDMVHRLRRNSCAVLVGRGTVEQDDCSLTVRRVELGEGKRQPVRVVMDPSLRILGGNYTLLNDGLPTIIYHLQTSIPVISPHEYVILVGLEPSDLKRDGKAFISPTEVVKDLKDRGFRHIMVEGGPATACAFLKSGVVDRAILVRAPIKFDKPIPAMMNKSTLEIAGLQMIGTAEVGGDIIEYWTRYGLDWPNQNVRSWP